MVIFIAAGDFNLAIIKTVLPKFYQHVNFATGGENTHDAYKATPRPQLNF